jgi:photosystem II stability/assembly factor-like uncharacterized protein
MISCLSPNGQTRFELDRSPTRLLVGSASGVAHLRRSDAGGRWEEESRSLVGKHIGALTNVPGGWIVAGCHAGGGLHRSRDNGNSWESVGQSIAATDVFSLAVLETAGSPPVILAGTEPVNLYCSDDLGKTWREMPSITALPGAEDWTFPPPPHIPHLKSMTIDGGAANSFYACVEQGALLRTADAGVSWVELDSMWQSCDEVYHDAHRLLIAPWNSQLLLLTSGLGLYRSENGGCSWTRSRQLSQFTKYPDVLVVAPNDKAIFVGGPMDYPVDWFVGNATGTICRSLDEGLTWVPVNRGLPQRGRANIEAMSIASFPGGYTLFCGNTDGEIFSSDNRGETWQQIAATGAISKGGHHKVAQMSAKLPKWAGASASLIFDKVTRFTRKRAAVKRKAAFSRAAHLTSRGKSD